MRIRIRLITLMRIQILIFLFDVDPDFYLMRSDPTFHPDADPDPSSQIKAQTLEKVLK
jgi:hypothetical protein